MRILLDAYFDMNFGDDLFVKTVLSRYPDARFTVFWKKTPGKVLERALRNPNMVIMPENCELQCTGSYDAYISVGGDIYPDGIDYSDRIARMEAVKKQGGFVAMLGFSLYANYSEATIEALVKMAHIADVVLCRDEDSAKLYRSFAPDVDIIAGTDMAFLNPVLEKIGNGDGQAKEQKNAILGFAPRRRLYTPDDVYEKYCNAMAQVADAYLEGNASAKVQFFALSVGEYDDRVTSEDIQKKMRHADRSSICAYEGDLEDFIDKMSKVSAMVPTRFHGMVIALACGIPFVPIPYEVKLKQLLNELKYDGVFLPYGEDVDGVAVSKALEQLKTFPVQQSELALYEQKKHWMFEAIDRYLADPANFVSKEADGEMKCKARELCDEQALKLSELEKQVKELEKWIGLLKEERKAFEKQSMDLEAIRVSQQQTIGDLQLQLQNSEMLREQVEEHREIQLHEKDKQLDELEYWIESLKDERKRFEIQNAKLEEIRKWQLEKLHKHIHNQVKLQREYNTFVQGLDAELKEKYGTSI